MKKSMLFFALALLATPWLHSQGAKNVHRTIQEIKFLAAAREIISFRRPHQPACWLLRGIGGTIGRRQEAAR